MRELILYGPEHWRGWIKRWAGQRTVRFTELEITEPFDTATQDIAQRLKYVLNDNEWREDLVAQEWSSTAAYHKVSHAQTERATSACHLDYDQHHQQEGPCETAAELKAPENTLKKCPKP